jgi:hypothetical protein
MDQPKGRQGKKKQNKTKKETHLLLQHPSIFLGTYPFRSEDTFLKKVTFFPSCSNFLLFKLEELSLGQQVHKDEKQITNSSF